MTQRKVALIIGYGQSNERGTGVAPRLGGTTLAASDTGNNVRHMAIFGQSNTSLTLTSNYVEPCSMFQLLAEHLALETGWIVQVINRAVGGRAATDHWCGWDSANARIKAPADAGYDPNSYIAGFVSAISAAVAQGYEVWTITAGHQQDLTLARPVDQITAASIHIQQRAIAAGASKVIVGRTPRYIGSGIESEWNTGGKIHQIATGVISAIPGAIVGGDLSTNTDTRLCATDDAQFIHFNYAGDLWGAEVHLNAMRTAKLF